MPDWYSGSKSHCDAQTPIPDWGHHMEQGIVAIISCYNARPEYLKTQIDSILAQSIPVTVFVRDDGSTHQETLDALRHYEHDDRVTVTLGKNVGFERGFMEALRLAPPARYYAFCDQDDKWLPEHAQYAYEQLEARQGADESTPLLYCSGFYDCDDSLCASEQQSERPYLITFENSLAEVAFPGMVMVLNNALRDLLLLADASQIPGHDWLAYVVATGTGTVIHDGRRTVLKRRHETNVSAGTLTGPRLLVFRIRTFLFGDYLKRLRTMYGECSRRYGHLLKPDDKRILQQFALPNSLGKALRKLTWPKRYRATIGDELGLRFMILLGRL